MSGKQDRKRGLGRGLSALMADVGEAETPTAQSTSEMIVPIENIEPNPDQPRRTFEEDRLEELSNSIQQKGVIQPLIVREKSKGRYEIVAGERRWRAAQRAQLHELPVVVRSFTDTEVLEVAIIENIQRADLNPVEEAAGYRQLMDRFGHTQEQLSAALGKSRSHIANLLRLLSLPESLLAMLRDNKLSAGHARALLMAKDPEALARRVISGGLSVRATEALVKKEQTADLKEGTKTARSGQPEKDADTRALEADLSANLGMKVSLNHAVGKEGGQLVLHYRSLEQLDDICRVLSGG